MLTVSSRSQVEEPGAFRDEYTDFAHTGPGTLAGRFLRRFWQPVAIGVDLPAGHARPIRVMGEDFTLYRGEEGAAHVVAPRCAHRGTQLSTGWVEDDCLRCFYHGWKYDGSGQCVEMPAEEASFPPKVRIAGYPTEEYLGLVFAYLGEGEAPPLPRYPDFEAEGVRENSTYLRACSYFQNVENALDPVHTAFVHRESGTNFVGLVGVPRMEGEESPWGIEMRGTRPNGKVRVNQYGMPNVLHLALRFGGVWGDTLAWRVPIDDEQHRSFSVHFAPLTGEAAEAYRARRTAAPRSDDAAIAARGETILRGEARVQDIAPDDPDLINVQDYVAQVGQGRLVDRAQDRLGCSDVLVILLRKLWARELQALAEGQPLTAWTRPAGLAATSGA
jgi:5,5'-dehydrodivanillate O-demethylase oxygenase subunit